MRDVSLVISCGGARGLSGIGVIEELEKRNYNISSVAGTSIGSLLLGVYASGNLQEYKTWVSSLSRIDVLRLMDFTFSKQGMIKGDKVFDEMKIFFKDSLIEDLPIPYSAVAADVNSFKEEVFSNGSLHQAIRCSISIPSLVKPVIMSKKVLVDGGIVNPLPLSRVKRKKNDLLIAINLNYFDSKIKQETSPFSLDYPIINNMIKYFSSKSKKNDIGNMMGFLNKTVYIMMNQLSQNAIDIYKPDLVINIPYNTCGMFDFHKSKELIHIGREKIKLALDFLEKKK